MRLYIGNIPTAATRDDLRAMFEHFGTVEAVGIFKDRYTGTSSGRGVIEMASASAAEIAITHLHYTQYGGRTISVSRFPAEQVLP